MKPQVNPLPFDEKYLAEEIKKQGKPAPDISIPATLSEDYVKDVKDPKPISAEYQLLLRQY